MSAPGLPRASYLLPIRARDGARAAELAAYLHSLHCVDVIVVDSSDAPVFDAHARAFGPRIVHVRPDPAVEGANGKVRNVLSGLRHCRTEKIVIADDDVRYSPWALRAVIAALDDADVVRPQNYFDPLPWHALLDTSRTLINRALDGDWPGTLGVRRSAAPFGYDADALFENLELVRTVKARGGRESVRRDLYVRRLPPTTAHYLTQRVRQAYDEFARPARMVAALTILPLCIARPAAIGALAGAAIGLSFAGWLRNRGYRHFPLLSVALAPLWLAERAICAWLALYERARYGGVRYAGRIVKRAASSPKELRRKWAV